MHDYSQSGQDDWVLSIIKHKGYFVDMGAYDGVKYSNTLRLEEAGWEGLCIEPNPENFELLWGNRKCRKANIAVTGHRGWIHLSNDGSSSQISVAGELYLPSDTIKNILDYWKAPKYIDYISSDLERMDAEVWESFPFNEYSFGLATVEHCLYEGNNNFKERIMKVMLDNGYVLAKENVESDGNAYEDWYCSRELCKWDDVKTINERRKNPFKI
jgi:hypothetical protein